jgi:hypothetical protein
MRYLLAALVLFAAVLAAACTKRDDSALDRASAGPRSSSSDGAAGPGISVAEARRSRLDKPLLVNGYLVADDSRVRLCDELAESSPPRCGGASLEVHGLDLDSLSDVESSGSVHWTAQPRLLFGEVKSGVLTVSGPSGG